MAMALAVAAPSEWRDILPYSTSKDSPTVHSIEVTTDSQNAQGEFGFWDTCVHQVIREHCQRSPDSPAVNAWDGSFTYAELDSLSDGIASVLVLLGVKPESIIPIYMQKSRWTTVAILGVLKSGGAFTLLDPSYPRSRLEEICKEIQARFILTSEELSKQCLEMFPALVVEHLSQACLLSPCQAGQTPSRPENAAYIAFTSGSTGKPKGIVIEHRSYCSGARSHLKVFSIDSTSRVLQFASYAFDVSIMETLSTLMAGGCLCVMSESERSDPNLFVESYKNLRISHCFMTPSFARTVQWTECCSPPPTLIVGGELMRPSDAVAYEAMGIRCMNAYGPAECSVNVSVQSRVEDGVDPRNIGYTTGATAWIVSPKDPEQLMPPGTVGELLVEGPIVGRGYLNDPSATRQAFIDTPAWLRRHRKGTSYQHRVYRTGDLASQDSISGALLLHGRKDAQVKIRGQRVELRDIEHHLQQTFPNGDAEVIVEKVTFSDDGVEKLIAFVLIRPFRTGFIPDNMGDRLFLAPQSQIMEQFAISKQHLQTNLPSYMVPDIFIPVSTIPQTASGKTDRRALRTRAAALSRRDVQCFLLSPTGDKRPPSTPKESTIRRLYSNVLNLPIDLIGMDDTFLRLGGDSLQAIRLVAEARTAGLILHAKDILSSQSTLAEQSQRAGLIQTSDHTGEASTPFALLPVAKRHDIIDLAQKQCGVSSKLIEDIYPCTALQEGMFLTSLKHPGMYTGQITFDIPDRMELPRLRAAWLSVMSENAALRTRIIETHEGLMQAVIVNDFAWEEETNEMLPSGRWEALEITKIGVPLVRFRYRPRHRQLIMTIHHSIWDGWSLRLVHEQLQRAYIGRDPLPSTSYRSFIQYTQDLPGADEFWASELAGVNAPIFPTLPSGNYRPYVNASHQHTVRNLVSTGREEHTTATYIHLAWSLLIAHYTDADETVYGVTINGRSADLPGIENIVGPTIATVPLRIRVNQEDTVKMALDQVQDSLARMIPYEQAGLPRISRCSRDASKGCRFQTLLIIEAPADRGVACEKNEPGNFSIIRGTTQTEMDYTAFSSYAMMLIFRTSADKSAITFDITYDAQVIGGVEVERMAHQFEHVLRHIYKPATERIRDINFLGPWDIEQVQQWNSYMPPADNRFLQELIFAQCSRRPQASAIISWDGSWTYQELWAHSSFVARQLQRYGVKRGTPVAVCLDRSRWSIAVILAVLLAGGTCVLIDLLSPRQRVRDILQIVGAGILVNSDATALVTSDLCPTVINVSLLAAQNDHSQTECPSNLDTWERGVGTPEDLAFIMFTSGSTGHPKGIEMPHRTLSTSIYHHSAGMKVKASSRVLHFSSYAFDVSIYEIFTTLTAGGTIYVPSEFDRMNNLAGFIRDTQVNWAFLTPSTARTLDPADVPLLTTLVLGGEAVTHESVEAWAKGRSLINGYGPAEATICGVGNISEAGWKSGVIGRIVGGLGWVTVPSDPTRLAAVGAVGELLLEGPFLARGYLNLPEVTRAAFIDPPSWRKQIPAPSPYPFLYRTGDLVRYQPDGSIQYIGRKDSRVKLRGQLVDLNAVEASLMRVYPAAIQVVADVLVSDSTARLIVLMKLGPSVTETHDDPMFETPDLAFNEAAASIQARLRAIVPPYMVPSVFIPLRHIPRTLTGKTDRRQLRDKLLSLSQSDLQRYIMSSAKTPMSDDNERSLQEIWAEVLRLPCEAIGREDSFLLLGGESLATIKMVGLARRLGFVFTVADVLNNMSLSTLARSRHLITEHDTPSPSPSLSLSTIDSQSLQEILRPLQNGGLIQEGNDIAAIHPVTAAQAFLVQRYPWSHFQFDLSGDISSSELQTACTALVARFTILRTVFVEHADHLLQLVLREVRECVHEITTDEPLDDFCNLLCQQQQGICVVSSTALPTLFTLVSNRQLNRRRLLLRLAHAQYDLTTIPLIVQALADEYNRTPRASLSSDFNYYLSHHMRQTNDDRAHTFWNQYLSGSAMTSTYQTANTTTPQKRIFHVTGLCTVTPASPPPGITTATAVKAAVCLVLASRTGCTDIVIGQTVDARCSSADSTLDQIVGPCTNYIPYRLSVCCSKTALEYLRSAQAQHTTSLRYSSLDLDQIVAKCTSWPSSTQFGYIVQHQDTGADLALSLGSGSTSSPMTSYGRVFPQGEVWIGSTPHSTGLKIDVIASSAVLSQEDAQAVAEEVGAALENLLGCGDRPLSDLLGDTSLAKLID